MVTMAIASLNVRFAPPLLFFGGQVTLFWLLRLSLETGFRPGPPFFASCPRSRDQPNGETFLSTYRGLT